MGEGCIILSIFPMENKTNSEPMANRFGASLTDANYTQSDFSGKIPPELEILD